MRDSHRINCSTFDLKSFFFLGGLEKQAKYRNTSQRSWTRACPIRSRVGMTKPSKKWQPRTDLPLLSTNTGARSRTAATRLWHREKPQKAGTLSCCCGFWVPLCHTPCESLHLPSHSLQHQTPRRNSHNLHRVVYLALSHRLPLSPIITLSFSRQPINVCVWKLNGEYFEVFCNIFTNHQITDSTHGNFLSNPNMTRLENPSFPSLRPPPPAKLLQRKNLPEGQHRKIPDSQMTCSVLPTKIHLIFPPDSHVLLRKSTCNSRSDEESQIDPFHSFISIPFVALLQSDSQSFLYKVSSAPHLPNGDATLTLGQNVFGEFIFSQTFTLIAGKPVAELSLIVGVFIVKWDTSSHNISRWILFS